MARGIFSLLLVAGAVLMLSSLAESRPQSPYDGQEDRDMDSDSDFDLDMRKRQDDGPSDRDFEADLDMRKRQDDGPSDRDSDFEADLDLSKRQDTRYLYNDKTGQIVPVKDDLKTGTDGKVRNRRFWHLIPKVLSWLG